MSVSKSTHRRGGRPVTRSQTRKPKVLTTLTKRRIYRERVKRSICRGKTHIECANNPSCKQTKSNKRKSYCRNSHNRVAGNARYNYPVIFKELAQKLNKN